jgi:hypothetical protein
VFERHFAKIKLRETVGFPLLKGTVARKPAGSKGVTACHDSHREWRLCAELESSFALEAQGKDEEDPDEEKSGLEAARVDGALAALGRADRIGRAGGERCERCDTVGASRRARGINSGDGLGGIIARLFLFADFIEDPCLPELASWNRAAAVCAHLLPVDFCWTNGNRALIVTAPIARLCVAHVADRSLLSRTPLCGDRPLTLFDFFVQKGGFCPSDATRDDVTDATGPLPEGSVQLVVEQSCGALEALLASEGTSVVLPWPESMLAQVGARGELLSVSLVPGYPNTVDDLETQNNIIRQPVGIPPELLLGEGSSVETWLAWGLGELVYWMVFGVTAFVSCAENTVQILETVLVADYSLETPLRESDLADLRPIISGTLVKNLEDRMDLGQIRNRASGTTIKSAHFG